MGGISAVRRYLPVGGVLVGSPAAEATGDAAVPVVNDPPSQVTGVSADTITDMPSAENRISTGYSAR